MSLYLGDIPIANDGSHGINTPFFFGQSQYFENAPYNASWLASNGSYNASTLYPDFWVQLTGVELNSSLNVGDTIEISGKTYVKRGLPVVLSTGTITDYDFVVNQNDQTFRLPLLNGEEDLDGSVPELISSSSIDYTLQKNGTVRVRGESASNSRAIVSAFSSSTSDADHAYSAGTLIRASARGKKGDLVHVLSDNCINVTVYFTPAIGNGTLYYYVGDTVQDASLINAGAVLGQLANKADIDASNFNASGRSYLSGLGMPSDTYEDWTLLASGQSYTAPANGYLFFSKTTTAVGQYIAMSKTYYQTGNTSPLANDVIRCEIQLLKGESVTVYYNAAGSTENFRFIYAEGEN